MDKFHHWALVCEAPEITHECLVESVIITQEFKRYNSTRQNPQISQQGFNFAKIRELSSTSLAI